MYIYSFRSRRSHPLDGGTGALQFSSLKNTYRPNRSEHVGFSHFLMFDVAFFYERNDLSWKEITEKQQRRVVEEDPHSTRTNDVNATNHSILMHHSRILWMKKG